MAVTRYTFNIPNGSMVSIPGMGGCTPIPPSSLPASQHLIEAAAQVKASLKRPKCGQTIWEVITRTKEDDEIFQWSLREIKKFLIHKKNIG
jgi:hypothetical protein